jgi:hypothetical protein
LSTLAIGIGRAAADSDSTFSKPVISGSIVRTSGIGGSSVEQNRITLECTTASVFGCFREANFTILDWRNWNTLGTHFFGGDARLECDPDAKIFIRYGGGANSELAVLSGRNRLHSDSINYPYERRDRLNARTAELGVLFSLGNRLGTVRLHFAPIDPEI